ncbi:hypothetical protein NDU88_001514 [Pleurodeles waltl]|uniref:Uncharacterized protein n=1 Tax=Pleurodeles waltl TaxID=8319 RepID=A0AAV7MLR1_PLEWA|nr:hypothetical protein NDU88_001514 [Pleurodeles waltl]
MPATVPCSQHVEHTVPCMTIVVYDFVYVNVFLLLYYDSCSMDDADMEGSAEPLNGPKQTGGGATTGRGISPETNDRNADGDDNSRLPYFGQGTRRRQSIEAGHALESVA